MLNTFIKSQRKKRGLTQQAVATEIGVSRPTYAQIERGERELTISEAQKLAAFFDSRLEDLISETEPGFTVILEDAPVEKPTTNEPDLNIRVTSQNLEKFKQVLLYVLNKVGGKPNVGETVLHKLLYFIDFDYYEKYEENLMGATYIKNHHGPTSVELATIVKDMEKKGELEVVTSQYFTYPQNKYLVLTTPDLKILSAQELKHIDWVLARLADNDAAKIEQYSHEDMPWMAAKQGENLNYEHVFYRSGALSVRYYPDPL